MKLRYLDRTGIRMSPLMLGSNELGWTAAAQKLGAASIEQLNRTNAV